MHACEIRPFRLARTSRREDSTLNLSPFELLCHEGRAVQQRDVLVSEALAQGNAIQVNEWASLIASATPSASVPGKSTSASEERGVGGLRRHAEWPGRRGHRRRHALFRAALRVK